MILKDFYQDDHNNAISKFILKEDKQNNSKALFLDRDGVLIEDVGHIDSSKKVKLCLNIIPFLEKAKEKNFDFIIVTNQSSVSRRIITYEKYAEITETLLSKLPEELYPKFILASFHLPDNSNNLLFFNWRKPGVGMWDYVLNRKKYNISESIMIGDKLSDLLPAFEVNFTKLLYIPSKIHNDEILKIDDWNKDHFNIIKKLKKLDPEYL